MNGEDAAAIVEADPGVDRGAVEEVSTQRRAAVIGGDARRQDQPDAAAVSRQLQRAVEEQLIAVGMSAGVMP